MRKIFLVLAVAALTFSCKNEEKAADSTTDTTTVEETVVEPTEEVATDVAGAVEVAIASDDQMKYDKNEIRVKAGQKVTLTLTHTGKMLKNMMGHNFVLLKGGVDMQEFALAAANASQTEYIPADKEGDIIAHTDLIGGGESTTITFDAPEVGEYDFLCTFPGHYAIMKGKFIVE